MAFVSQDGKQPLPDPISFTVTAMMEAYAASRQDEERTYLGASAIGEECERALWYGFRWCSPPEKLDGRKVYLFDTGHVEEDRMLAALTLVPGVQVVTRGENGRQLGFQAIGGHFRGHMDGQALGLPEAPATWHVVECKTHNAKSFRATAKHGVAAEKPEHVVQANLYMHFTGHTRCLYLYENKDDSWIDAQRLEYDPDLASSTLAKAERVIKAAQPLARLHEDPSSKAAFKCGYCDHLKVCHHGGWARLHCRSCLHATPVDQGWHCARHDTMLDVAVQRKGCANHLYIPGLVPGEQVDASEEDETVTYRLHDGSTWVDGVTA